MIVGILVLILLAILFPRLIRTMILLAVFGALFVVGDALNKGDERRAKEQATQQEWR
jgi:hypothetical protein